MAASLNHIFCIDDEEDILEIAKMALEDVGGYQVTACNDGAQALEMAMRDRPDLFLIDVMMPLMDGVSVLRVIRNLPDYESIPIIFMTARVQPNEVREYMEMGAAGVIEKPFDPMKLPSQIQALWEKLPIS